MDSTQSGIDEAVALVAQADGYFNALPTESTESSSSVEPRRPPPSKLLEFILSLPNVRSEDAVLAAQFFETINRIKVRCLLDRLGVKGLGVHSL